MENIDDLISSLEKEKEYLRARSNINDLASLVMRDSITNAPFTQGDIHREIQAWIDEYFFTIIWAPRNHGKTEQVSILRPLYYLGNNHNERIKIICASDELAIKRLDRVKDLIIHSDDVHRIFPTLKPDYRWWRKKSIRIQREISSTNPSIEASGVMSTGTGDRATIIIVDDCCSLRNSIQQPKMREAVKDKFFDVLTNTLEPGGRVIYISTPWHKDDLSHDLIRSESYKWLHLEIDDEFNPIWPEKRPKSWLIEKYKQIGSRRFDRGYRNKALSDDEIVFSPDVIDRLPNYKIKPISKMFNGMESFIGVDFAGGANSKGYTVFFVVSLGEDRKRWVRSIKRGHFSGGQMANIMTDLNDIYNEPTFVVENNGVQQVIIDLLEIANKDIVKVVPFHTGMKKMDLTEGVPSLALEMEQGMWEFCMFPSKHEVSCVCDFCVCMRELKDFPLARYSDTVMSLYFARQGIRMQHEDNTCGFEVVPIGTDGLDKEELEEIWPNVKVVVMGSGGVKKHTV